MDLSPYICRGFGESFDRAMADVPVKGIDREQTLSMVRLCAQTEPLLYGSFSPTRIRYRKGARPKLEQIAATLNGTGEMMNWVTENVRHPHFAGFIAPDRALSEEQLIDSHIGWCNEQCRVFIALCEVMEIPARLCFLFHKNGHTAHTATEIFLDGKWAFCDVTFNVSVKLSDGTLAEARELQGDCRHLAHEAYRPRLERYYREGLAPKSPDAPSAETGGDYLHGIGITNYLIDGVCAA